MKSVISILFFITIFTTSSTIVYSQPPRLNSYPYTRYTIFLDFDGQYVSGTAWNWNGDIDAQGSGLSNAAIIEVFNRVSEDYRPFNLNITTDSTIYFEAPFNKRIRVIVTPTHDWYGSAGGISYVGSFNWGNETPAWVFSGLLSYNIKYVAEACSHEIGHTLGLQHQSIYDANCNKTSEYDEGRGEGEIGWAPIMGVGYYQNVTTWSTGPNTESCNTIQSDLSIIGGAINGFGFREDDHGDDLPYATNIILNGLSFSANGLINAPADIDIFKFSINAAANLKLTAIPQNVGWGNAGADIDIKITLKNEQGNVIGIYNPAMILNVGIDTNLNTGNYFILVTGTGNINHSSYGSLGYYSLVGNLGMVLPVHEFVLRASSDNSNHILNWTYTADEKIKALFVEASADGTNFHDLVALNASARTFSYRPFENDSYYRLKAVTQGDEKAYYSGISMIASKEITGVKLISNISNGNIFCTANGRHTYRLFDTGGRLLQTGTLVNGMNTIQVATAAKGILLLQLSNGVKSWTERLIKQ